MEKKKINPKKKGDKAENEVYKILQGWGYIVNPAPRTMRRVFSKGKIFYVSQRNDIWGLFDGTARLKGGTVLHFQVKSTLSKVSSAKPGISSFFMDYCNKYETCEIWLRVLRRGFVIYKLSHEIKWEKKFINLKGESCEPFKISN